MSAAAHHRQRLVVFDTSLRDVMQLSSRSLPPLNVLVDLAKSISRLNVDFVEAGFPVRSKADYESVAQIAKVLGAESNVGVAALARANVGDVERANEALQRCPKDRRRIHIFHPSEASSREAEDQKRHEEQIVRAVKRAKQLCDDVQFSAEDAVTTPRTILSRVIIAAAEAGASTICLSDSLGYAVPSEYGAVMRWCVEELSVKHGLSVTWSCHCHNDLGMATANTLQGVQDGARQIEASVLGVGPKAGRAALDEIVLNISARPNLYPVWTQVSSAELHRTAVALSDMIGIDIHPLKPFLGKHAFMSEGGLYVPERPKHDASSYHIITPEEIGVAVSSLPLGPRTDFGAFKIRLDALGFSHLSERDKTSVFQRFIRVVNLKQVVTDQDISAMAASMSSGDGEEQSWKIESIQVVTGTLAITTATIALLSPPRASTGGSGKDSHARRRYVKASVSSNGAIDAVYNAIVQVVGIRIRLLDFEIKSVGEGTDALGKVTVRIAQDHGSDTDVSLAEAEGPEATFIGHGTEVDILLAAAAAFVQALSRLQRSESYSMSSSQAAGLADGAES